MRRLPVPGGSGSRGGDIGGRSRQVAIVAAARKLACLLWCMLTRDAYAYGQPSSTRRSCASSRSPPARRATRARPNSGRITKRWHRPSANSPSRPNWPTRAPSVTGRQRTGERWASAVVGLKGPRRAAGYAPDACTRLVGHPRPQITLSPRSGGPTATRRDSYPSTMRALRSRAISRTAPGRRSLATRRERYAPLKGDLQPVAQWRAVRPHTGWRVASSYSGSGAMSTPLGRAIVPGSTRTWGEERLIGKRLEDTAPLMFVEGDVADRAVLEAQAQAMVADDSTRLTSTSGSGASVMSAVGVATPNQCSGSITLADARCSCRALPGAGAQRRAPRAAPRGRPDLKSDQIAGLPVESRRPQRCSSERTHPVRDRTRMYAMSPSIVMREDRIGELVHRQAAFERSPLRVPA
jgi:hypothetical protein